MKGSGAWLTGGMIASLASLFLAVGMFPFFTDTAALEQMALLYRVGFDTIPRETLSSKERIKAIEVDLNTMQVTLIENGAVVDTVPVLARGKSGTFWETPTGDYKVNTKEINHYSSIGHVWMPYSMQFFGNYFIHGWPYDDEGRNVSSAYSGGCIRLATEDARKVYEFASVGTPIHLTGGPVEELGATTTFRYFLKSGGLPPDIRASQFLVADIETGEVLWERNSTEQVALTNLTPLMSGIVALETVNQYKTVRMSELILGTPIPRSRVGGYPDELPIGALIYPLMFSGNDTAATAFAADHGERTFVRGMNEKARAIGMNDTVYASSTASQANLGTARDAFILLRYLNEHKRFLIDATLREEHVIKQGGTKEDFRWDNVNPLYLTQDSAYRGGVMSIATGTSGVGASVWSASLTEFGERPIAIILLGTEDPASDTLAIRRFIMSHFVYAPELSDYAMAWEHEEETSGMWGKIRDLFLMQFRMQEHG